MILDLVTNPDAFFRAEAESPRLWGAAGVVLLAGVVGAITSFLLLSRILTALPADVGPAVALLSYTFGVGGALVTQFVVWVLFAVVFHVISIVFDGEGDFRKTLALTGWGFVPAIFGGLLGLGAMYLALQGIPSPTTPEAIEPFTLAVTRSSVLQVAGLVGIAFTLWSAFLWAFAVKYARHVTLGQGILIVALPVAVSIALTLASQLFVL
ncbi:Yip1 family protein [Haladaptatus sp. GCM10025707]|uniref:Yip1 family protein n=1 Tax=unclassified Haladaptatus TaxID=2622732 RepID=UPI0023E7726E|nr:Yip1 family protein [Haladaptatus sp. QDMS2]